MNAKTRHDFQPCVPGAFEGGLARTAFFDGMVLTEGDMVREQSYWRGKRKLTNRALGQGVVWGLAVHWDSRARRLCLSPGYGLSCCGDDLVVSCSQAINETELIDRCSEDFRHLLAHAAGPRGHCDQDARPDGPIDACLLLEYVECAEGLRQAFEDGCDSGDSASCRYGAVRETTRLRLVPPPPPPDPGAIAAFCERIEALRVSLEGTAGAVVEPLRLRAEPAARLSLAYLDNAAGGGNTLAAQGGSLALQSGATGSVTLAAATGAASLRVGLEPPPGYVFTSLEVAGVVKGSAEALMGAFHTYTPPPTAVNELVVKAQVAPLFGTAPGWAAEIRLRVEPATGGGAATLNASVQRLDALPTRTDCASLLAGGLLLQGDAGCTGRTLALAGLCGWFVSQLGPAGCVTSRDVDLTPDDEARLLMAWSICRVAWRGLFGIDPALAPEAGLEKCLQQLFRAWCEGLHYKGPRCDCHAHGIVLGTLQLSPKGRVLCFDEWKHRRHVLTGPLLTHWGAQVGLAPLDQGVAQLASWVCCVARTPLPELPAGVAWPDDALLQMAGGALAMGRSYAENDRVAGAAVRSVQQISGGDFALRTLDMIMGRARPTLAAVSQLNVWSAPGSGLNLLQPIESRGLERPDLPGYRPEVAKAEALMAEIGLAHAAVPGGSRRVLRDFVASYAESVPLTLLKPRAEAASFEPMVAALEASGVATVADLLALGPEAALERATPKLGDATLADARTAEKTAAVVYDSAVKALAGAGQAVADKARASEEGDPFTRSELVENSTLSAVRKAANVHLRDRGLSAADLRGIAVKAAARRG
jgi:hypothetical protein